MSARLEVYFDGWCPICTGAKDRLALMDRRGRLAFRSMREHGVAEQVGVDAAALAARMHARSAQTGRVVSGITAVRWVAAALPSLWLSVPFLWLAEKIGIGARLYDWIAARRPIIPVGHCEDGACPIHQPKP
jgi:predicted DCC family thiol-disulfide oxidoreductase YuxK